MEGDVTVEKKVEGGGTVEEKVEGNKNDGNSSTNKAAPNTDANINLVSDSDPSHIKKIDEIAEKRVKKLSGKMLEHQKNEILKRRSKCYNRLQRQFTLVTQCMESSSIDMVNMETANMDRQFAELVDLNLKYLHVLQEEAEQEECHDWINNVDETVFSIKSKVCSWLKESDPGSAKSSKSSRSGRSSERKARASSRKSARSDSVKSKDSVRSKRSNQSKQSNHSSASKASSASSVENKAHLAGLQSKMESLESNWKSVLDTKVLQLQQSEETKMKEQMLKLKEEIVVTKAKQHVYDEEDNVSPTKHISTKSVKFGKTSHALSTRRRSSSENKDKSRKKRKRSSNSETNKKETNDNVVKINELIIDMMKLSSAPVVKLDEFSGNVLEFEYFKANLKEMVQDKVKDQRGRLMRLLQCTSGEAKDLIKGCVHENSNTCFDKAMDLLNKEYGDVHAITCAYLKELRSWPSVRNNDAKAYKNIYRFLLKCQSFKKSSILAELDSTDMIRTILLRFPTSTQDNWNKVSCKIREKEKREAKFDDLVSFIDYQSRLLSNPAYSRDAFSTNNSTQHNNNKNDHNNNKEQQK